MYEYLDILLHATHDLSANIGWGLTCISLGVHDGKTFVNHCCTQKIHTDVHRLHLMVTQMNETTIKCIYHILRSTLAASH